MNIPKTLQQIFLASAISFLFSAEASASLSQAQMDQMNPMTTKAQYDADQAIIDASKAAPEIDATSGTSAITLLSGVIILAIKRSRSRKATNS